MKRGHLVILYSMLFALLFISALYARAGHKRAVKERKQVDYALQMSVDAAADQLAKRYQNANLSDYLDAASEEFFRGLVAGMNLYEDEDKAGELVFFVPALLVTSTDGFFINYLAEITEAGSTSLSRKWTEIQPYTYEDAYYIYRFFLDDYVIIYEKESGVSIKSAASEVLANGTWMSLLTRGDVFHTEATYYEYKKAAVSDSIARVLDRTVNEHGRIAGQVGISIVYGVPEFLNSYTPAQEYPSVIAVFQGYPLTADNKIIYNGASTSAAYISDVARYVVEVSDKPSQPFSVFHKSGCTEVGTYGQVLDEKCTTYEAVSIYGAYGCPWCFTERDGVAILH